MEIGLEYLPALKIFQSPATFQPTIPNTLGPCSSNTCFWQHSSPPHLSPDTTGPDFHTTWQTPTGYDGPSFSAPVAAPIGYGGIEAFTTRPTAVRTWVSTWVSTCVSSPQGPISIDLTISATSKNFWRVVTTAP
ncbi:MAG: hypothetical protein QNL68_17380 [Akkermansiaceae bacterium]